MESPYVVSVNNCRLCDQQTKKMYSIFDKNDTGQQILHLIKELLPIVVSKCVEFNISIYSGWLFW